jgi:glycerophosphoryl diester phosphodiesterase
MKPLRSYRVLAVIAGLLTICSANSQAQHIIAHRGASQDAPENTLAAFRLAWEQGADGIEADFLLSSDGRIVCIHDRDTRRVAGKKLVVSASTLAELKKLDVGRWKDAKYTGQRIPTIEEVIATIPTGKMFFIELKVGPEIVLPLKKVIEKSTLKPEQIVIISFKRDTLAACEKHLPHLTTHWLAKQKKHPVSGEWGPIPADVIRTVIELHVDGFGSQANPKIFDAKYIESLRRSGIKDFHVWTVDDVETARFYQAQRAFSITTNRPALLRNGLFTQQNGEK